MREPCSLTITEECLTCSHTSRGTWRRVHGIDLPWSIQCYGSNAVATLLIIGFYSLLSPCIHLSFSALVTALHAAGISVYAWLLTCEAADPHCLEKKMEPTPSSKWRAAPLPFPPPPPRPFLPRRCHHCYCYVSGEARTKHCHSCSKCVDGFDHHCDFLQTCVGRRNYRAFITLVALLFTWTATLIVLDCLVLLLPAMDHCHSSESPWRVVLLGLHCLIALACICGVGLLLFLHLYFIATSQTTYEWLISRHERMAQRMDRSLTPNSRRMAGLSRRARRRFSKWIERARQRVSSARARVATSPRRGMTSSTSRTNILPEAGGEAGPPSLSGYRPNETLPDDCTSERAEAKEHEGVELPSSYSAGVSRTVCTMNISAA